MIKSDMFTGRPSMHVKMSRDVHVAFRSIMLSYGVSMQEALEEFAVLVAEGDKTADSIIKRVVDKKLRSELKRLDERLGRMFVNKKQKKWNEAEQKSCELDTDALYNLISGDKKSGGQDEAR